MKNIKALAKLALLHNWKFTERMYGENKIDKHIFKIINLSQKK